MSFYDDLSFDEIKKNVTKQGTKILHDIAVAFGTGVFDNPQSSTMFCSLLACICEGKVEGSLSDEDGLVKWALTKEYHSELLQQENLLIEEMEKSGNLVRGPWK